MMSSKKVLLTLDQQEIQEIKEQARHQYTCETRHITNVRHCTGQQAPSLQVNVWKGNHTLLGETKGK